MKESRRLKIESKVFEKKNILSLAEKLKSEYIEAQKQGDNSSLTYQIACSDNTTYESETLDLFDDEGIIDIKRSTAIEMTYWNHTQDKHINISLVHGGGYSDGAIIRGCNKDWVRGVFTDIKEKFDSIKPQANWILKHKTLLLHLLALGAGVVTYFVIWLIFYRNIEPIENPSEQVKAIRLFFKARPLIAGLLNWFLFWVMGIGTWAFPVWSWLLKLWPTVEFDFGPEHMKLEKQRRIRTILVFSIIIIPTFLAIAYDVAKAFVFQ